MIRQFLYKNSDRYASKYLVLLIDLFIVFISFFVAYLIRYNLSFSFSLEKFFFQAPLILAIHFISFLIFGTFEGVVRHTGIKDVYNLFNSVCLSSIGTIVAVLILTNFSVLRILRIPLSVIVINSLLTFLLLIGLRYVFKLSYDSLIRKNSAGYKNVLIYGAGESAIITYNALANHTKSNVRVVGFIDDDKRKQGKKINGVAVYSNNVLNQEYIKLNDVSEVIFSVQNISSKKLRSLVDQVMELPIKPKIVPPVEDWINGQLKVSQIKEIQIEDLLDRAPIEIVNKQVAKDFLEKTIMVTGGAGSIGSELVRQICRYRYQKLIVLDQAESALYDLQQDLKQSGFTNFIPIVGDIRDEKKIQTYFDDFKPDIIFHAAAYKHVPLMESNPYEAIRVNIIGTKSLVDLADKFNVKKFVFVSTDKAVNPTNIMGATKRAAEMYISCKNQFSKTKYVITRFGNVLGSNGSVIPLFKKQIEKGGPLTVTHEEITRFFMTIPEASQLVLQAGTMGEGGEIFIFDMGESVKIIDLAKNMIRLSGLHYPEDINIKITGLRPGEKLYEELLANGENTLPTYHEKIMISKVKEYNTQKIMDKINQLCLSNLFLHKDSVSLLKEIVPEYISNNSEFSKLDVNKNLNEMIKRTETHSADS